MRRSKTRNTIHYNLGDVAKLLGVCKQTIYNYMNKEKLVLTDFNNKLETLVNFIHKYKD